MNVIAEVDISHRSLALAPTIESVPSAAVQVVPQSGTDPETGMFFFLVETDREGFDRFEAALEEDHTVDDWLLVSESDTARLYRLCHSEEAKLLSPPTAEVGGLMLEATSGRRGWSVRLQLPDRSAVTELWEFCEAEGITFELRQLYREENWTIGGVTGLTDAQRVALLTAYREGYFSEPRETSLEELAEELDISPTAVGGRIRRGTERLVEATLADE
jgi:hypothetical protein